MGFFSELFGLEKSSSADVAAAISQGAFLVDVRSKAEFQSGSAKGATNIPLDQIPQQINKFKGKEHIVVFCRSGNRSGQAKRILNGKGFNHVIDGGTWQMVDKIVKEKTK